MINMHLTLTEFRNESRVLKQTASLEKAALFKKIFIVALGAEDLKEYEQLSNAIEVHRINLKTRNLPRNFLFQVIKFIEYFFRALLLVRKQKVKVLNLHTIALLPLGWVSKVLNRHLLIYDTHELETEVVGGKSFRKSLSKLIEKLLIKKADLTLVVSENIADWYASQYKMPRPPVVKNAPWAQTPAKTNVFREKFAIRDDQTIFLYQGGLMPGRGVPFILETFKARTNDQAVIVFMGYGELEEQIIQASKETNTIFYMPAVPPEQVLEHTVAADVGLSLIENTCLSYFYCMPNKLFEYSMAGLAVVVSNMKEMAEFVTQNNSGFVLEDMTVEALNNLIEQVLMQNGSKLTCLS